MKLELFGIKAPAQKGQNCSSIALQSALLLVPILIPTELVYTHLLTGHFFIHTD